MILRPYLSLFRALLRAELLTLITGQPGNGKTLYTIAHVEEMRKQENRPVFYYGIPELKLDWFLLDDPTKWHECPEKAIIVMDEVQKVMPPRPSSSRPPPFVVPLETHRHKGYDIFFMTQDPSLVDNHIKKLAGEHVHLIRQFGRETADVFKMQKVQDPTNANLKRAQRSSFPYPKQVYDWYKSAEAHTHKKKLPLKYKLMFVLPFVCLAALGGGGKLLWDMAHPKGAAQAKAEPAAEKKSAPSAVLNGPPTGADQSRHVMSSEEYIDQYQPRVPGLAYTAPVYDQLTKPKRVPVPAACVTGKSRCQCYTQQGTKLRVNADQCAQIVRDGFFMEFDPDGEETRQPVRQAEAYGGQQIAAAGRPVDPIALSVFDREGR